MLFLFVRGFCSTLLLSFVGFIGRLSSLLINLVSFELQGSWIVVCVCACVHVCVFVYV